MKNQFRLCSAVLLMLCGGCFFRPPVFERHDYEVGEINFVSKAESAVKIGTVRNLSGADRRFLFRSADNEMISDDANSWLLLPGVMLERELAQCFHAQTGREPVIVETTIRRFELTKAGSQFRFAVLYQLRRGDRFRTLTFDCTEKVRSGNVPAALATAMQKSFIALDRAIGEFSAETGRKK